jgi:hypothetical protein
VIRPCYTDCSHQGSRPRHRWSCCDARLTRGQPVIKNTASECCRILGLPLRAAQCCSSWSSPQAEIALIPCRAYKSSGEPDECEKGDMWKGGETRIWLASVGGAAPSTSLRSQERLCLAPWQSSGWPPPDLRDGSLGTSTTRKLTSLACRSQPQAAQAEHSGTCAQVVHRCA